MLANADPEAVGRAVLALLDDANPRVRKIAIEVIAIIRRFEFGAIPDLSTLFERDIVHREVLQALQLLGPDASPAIPALMRLLCGRDRFMSEIAGETLIKIGPQASSTLDKALTNASEENTGRILGLLEKIGRPPKERLEMLLANATTVENIDIIRKFYYIGLAYVKFHATSQRNVLKKFTDGSINLPVDISGIANNSSLSTCFSDIIGLFSQRFGDIFRQERIGNRPQLGGLTDRGNMAWDLTSDFLDNFNISK